MKLQELRKIAEKLKEKQDERAEYKQQLCEQGLLEVYEKCEDASCRVDFLNERERQLYCKALFKAFVWGINVSSKK